MKKNVLIAVAAALSLAACQKTDLKDIPAGQEKMGMLSITLEKPIETKAVSDYIEVLPLENAEKSVDVLVFNDRGNLEASKTLSSSSAECNFKLKSGKKTVWAIINAPDISSVISLSQLRAVVEDFAVRNPSVHGFVMAGSTQVQIAGPTSPVSASVKVSRLVSRVVLSQLVNKLPSQYKQMTVHSIFLADVNTTSNLASDTFGNKVNIHGKNGGRDIAVNGEKGLCDAYLFTDIQKSVANGGNLLSGSEKKVLYAQPNPTAEYSRLLIYATVGDVTGYYKIPLNHKLERNTTYNVSATVLGLPDLNPLPDNSSKVVIDVKITVEPWIAGNEYTPEI